MPCTSSTQACLSSPQNFKILFLYRDGTEFAVARGRPQNLKRLRLSGGMGDGLRREVVSLPNLDRAGFDFNSAVGAEPEPENDEDTQKRRWKATVQTLGEKMPTKRLEIGLSNSLRSTCDRQCG